MSSVDLPTTASDIRVFALDWTMERFAERLADKNTQTSRGILFSLQQGARRKDSVTGRNSGKDNYTALYAIGLGRLLRPLCLPASFVYYV